MVAPVSDNRVKSYLSVYYVGMIASMARFNFSERPEQYDTGLKIDGDIAGCGYEAGKNGAIFSTPHMHLQLKSTVNVDDIGDNIHYELDVDTFNILSENGQQPHLLVLLVLPKDSDKWVTHTPHALISRKCAYWCSLLEYPDKPKLGKKHIIIKIPKCNHFSVEQLRELMDRTSRKEKIKYGSL